MDIDNNTSLSELLDFCNAHKTVYIYGAGNYGHLYKKILEHFGIPIKGFIVTGETLDSDTDTPIFCLNDISRNMSVYDGIIPAFTESDPSKIQRLFSGDMPDVLSFDHKKMLCIADMLFFEPIKNKLDNEYSLCIKKKTDYRKWKRILVIRTDAIGDLVFITAFLRELKRNIDDCLIDIVVRESNCTLVDNCPYVNNIFPYKAKLVDGELSQQCESAQQVEDNVVDFAQKYFKGTEYDAVFLPKELLCGRNMLDDIYLAYYSGAKCRYGQMLVNDVHEKYLYDLMKNSFTSITVNDKPLHQVQYSLAILKSIGMTIYAQQMELWPFENDVRLAQDKFNHLNGELIIALGIMATAPKRVWNVRNYIKLIDNISNLHEKFFFVLFGGDDAIDMAKTIIKNVKRKDRVIDLVSKLQLNQTVAYISCCDLYVGSNTGILHFASAMNVPSVTIYSELDDGSPIDGDAPERMGAWGVSHIDLIPPSGLDGCHGVCRKHYSHCINQITPGQVYSAIRSLMSV